MEKYKSGDTANTICFLLELSRESQTFREQLLFIDAIHLK